MNILLTCAGRRNYLLQFFKEALRGRGQVFTSDTNPIAPAMQEADKSFIVPNVYSPDYIDSLLSLCTENQVGLLVPLNDLELPVLAGVRDLFLRIGTIPVVASPEAIDTCFDKWKTCRFATDNAIGVPLTFISPGDVELALSRGQLKFPLVAKPRWGTASLDIDISADLYELHLSYQLIRSRLPRSVLGQISSTDLNKSVLIQEMLNGQEYGLDVVNDLEGRHVCTFVKKKLGMRAGETDKAITVADDELAEFGAQIGCALGHVGNLDCDVFVTEDGIRLLEMNPRFGGGYPFSHVAGANIPAALIAWAEQRDPDPSWLEAQPGIIAAKCDRLVIQNV